MIRAPFQLHTPPSIEEAVRLLSQCVQNGEDAKLLAGGQSLLPSMNLGLVAPGQYHQPQPCCGSRLYSPGRGHACHRCGGHSPRPGRVRGVTNALSDSQLKTAASIGDVQVRNRGTLGRLNWPF